MAKYAHLSRVYLSDQELFELMSPKNIPTRELLKKLRTRGLFFSNSGGAEAKFRLSASLLPSDWNLVETILARMERPDPRGRKSNQVIKNCVPAQDFCAAITELEAERGKKYGEVFKASKSPDGTVTVEVSYTEVDYSVAVPYQRQQRKIQIEISEGSDGVVINHSSDHKALQIVEGLKGFVKYTTPNEPDVQMISVASIRTPELRTRFFMLLIRGIEGFSFDNASYITVERRFPELEPDEEDAPTSSSQRAKEDAKNRSAEKKVRGLVNRVSLQGEQVETAELYEHAQQTGYFVAGMKWTVISKRDSRIHLDLEASFEDPIEGTPFVFSVVRQWEFSAEDPDVEELIPLDSQLRRRFEQLLFDAAVKAQASVMDAQRTSMQEENLDGL